MDPEFCGSILLSTNTTTNYTPLLLLLLLLLLLNGTGVYGCSRLVDLGLGLLGPHHPKGASTHLGFRASGLGFRALGLGLKVQGIGLRV